MVVGWRACLGGGLSADAITEKDRVDLTFALDQNLDFIAVSFPSCAADLQPVRDAINHKGSQAHIIAKIERAEAVASEEALLSLIDASDGVMVARGDLGVEIGDAELPGVQKRIIAASSRPSNSSLPIQTACPVLWTIRIKARASVDFPQPDSPTIPSVSPCFNSKSTPPTA